MSTEKKKKNFILTPVFRVSFPDIVERSDMSNKYRVQMLFEKGTDLSELVAEAKAARKDKWPKVAPKGFQSPFMKVDDMDADERYDGYEDGMVILAASSSYRPGVVDKQRNPIDLEELDTVLYGGMYARAAINAFAYDTKGNKGVAFGLNAIQIVKDGEPLGSRVSAEEAFADVEDVDYEDDDAAADGGEFEL